MIIIKLDYTTVIDWAIWHENRFNKFKSIYSYWDFIYGLMILDMVSNVINIKWNYKKNNFIDTYAVT